MSAWLRAAAAPLASRDSRSLDFSSYLSSAAALPPFLSLLLWRGSFLFFSSQCLYLGPRVCLSLAPRLYSHIGSLPGRRALALSSLWCRVIQRVGLIRESTYSIASESYSCTYGSSPLAAVFAIGNKRSGRGRGKSDSWEKLLMSFVLFSPCQGIFFPFSFD